MTAHSPDPMPDTSTAWKATAIGSTSAPISSETFSGSGNTMLSGNTVNSESPPPCPDRPWKASTRQVFGDPARQAGHSPQVMVGRETLDRVKKLAAATGTAQLTDAQVTALAQQVASSPGLADLIAQKVAENIAARMAQ